MSEKRFDYVNGSIHDAKSKGDTNLDYRLNSDDGRLELVGFMNDREQMIDSLNNEITRLQNAIDEYGVDVRNLHNRLRKQERISNNYKEMVMLLIETIGEIE